MISKFILDTILCYALAKYSVLADSRQLFAAKYLPYLPTEEELAKEVQRERALLSNIGEQDKQ